MRAAIEQLRRLADEFGGCETGDGLFLNGVADAIEHGDAMDELGGKTLLVAEAEGSRRDKHRGDKAVVADGCDCAICAAHRKQFLTQQ